MKIPYIIEEFKDNEWHQVSNPRGEVYAKAQYEVLVNMKKKVRCRFDGETLWSN